MLGGLEVTQGPPVVPTALARVRQVLGMLLEASLVMEGPWAPLQTARGMSRFSGKCTIAESASRSRPGVEDFRASDSALRSHTRGRGGKDAFGSIIGESGGLAAAADDGRHDAFAGWRDDARKSPSRRRPPWLTRAQP